MSKPPGGLRVEGHVYVRIDDVINVLHRSIESRSQHAHDLRKNADVVAFCRKFINILEDYRDKVYDSKD